MDWDCNVGLFDSKSHALIYAAIFFFYFLSNKCLGPNDIKFSRSYTGFPLKNFGLFLSEIVLNEFV